MTAVAVRQSPKRSLSQHQLYFTAIPDQAESTLCARANVVRDYLEHYIAQTCNIDVTVAYQPVSTYDSAVDALVKKIADFGWYGGLTGVQAGLQMQPAVYLAQRIEDTKFTSVFIQGSDNNMTPSLSNITDVEGRSLALGSQTSTSGSLMPMYYLTQSNVTPSSIMYMGSHDATVDAVINGEAQVGALNSVVWKNRVAANATGGTSVFYTTEEYVDYLWVAGSRINDKWASIQSAAATNHDATIKDEACSNINTLLTNAFLVADASDSLGVALLEAYSTVGYVAITEGEYDPIEETGCAQGLIASRYCNEPVQVPEEQSAYAYAATPESPTASTTSKASKSGTVVKCGDIVHGKISLKENLVCEGSGENDGIPNAVLTLDGPNAVLNCEGFTITQDVAENAAVNCIALNGYEDNLETDSTRVQGIKNNCGLHFLYGIVLLNGATAEGCNIENFLVGAYFGLEAEELSDVTASKNRFGVVVETNKKNAKITNLIAQDNGEDGVHARNDGKSIFVRDYNPGGSIDLKSITATGNGDDGIEIAGSDIDVIDTVATGNGNIGIVINGDVGIVIEGSKISITDTEANDNVKDGFYVRNTKKIELENVDANNNRGGFGILIEDCPALELSLKESISLNGNINGLGTISGTAGTISNFGELEANKNTKNGILMAVSEVAFSIEKGASLSACGNTNHDIFIPPIPGAANTLTLEKGGTCTGLVSGPATPACADCTTAAGFS